MSPPAQERQAWGNQCEFFLTSLGLAVGLGNVWRFPYVAYANGGGTFLVPYLIMLVLIGFPGLFLEQTLGQWGRAAVNKVYGRMAPLASGLGYGMLLISYLNDIYYAVIMAWTIFYIAAGFQSTLPWGSCTSAHNTADCFSIEYQEECNSFNNDSVFYRKECVPAEEYCIEHDYEGAESGNCYVGPVQVSIPDVVASSSISPAEDYFNGKVLGITDPDGTLYDLENYGYPQWELVLCLLFAWTLVTLVLIKGIQSYGKAAYAITLSPYFVLTALIIYTAQLPGAGAGIEFYLTPDWDKLFEVDIWRNAASQILFSLGVGFGSQLILASYNGVKNNNFRDSVLIAIFNSGTSIYAGFVVFSIIGFLAETTSKPIEEVVSDGIKLAFVVYPSAVLEMDVSPLWSFLFFFMLLNLALSSSCGGVQNFAAFIMDQWPKTAKHPAKVVIGVCVSFFLFGLLMTFKGGLYLFNIFDTRLTASLLFITVVEMVFVGWIYGINTYLRDVAQMGMNFVQGPFKFIGYYWLVIVNFVAPAILTFLTIMAFVDYTPMNLNGNDYPVGWQVFGWIMELAPMTIAIVWVPISFLRKGRAATEPTQNWYDTDRTGALPRPSGYVLPKFRVEDNTPKQASAPATAPVVVQVVEVEKA